MASEAQPIDEERGCRAGVCFFWFDRSYRHHRGSLEEELGVPGSLPCHVSERKGIAVGGVEFGVAYCLPGAGAKPSCRAGVAEGENRFLRQVPSYAHETLLGYLHATKEPNWRISLTHQGLELFAR